MNVNLIVAVDNDFGIGKDGKIPWNLPSDRVRFSHFTKNHICVFGRKTYETLPKLNDREIIVMSSQKNVEEKKNKIKMISSDPKEIIAFAKKQREHDLFICGGEDVYKEFLPFYSHIFMTHVYNNYGCDRFCNIYNYFDIKEENVEAVIYATGINIDPKDSDQSMFYKYKI